VLTLPPSSISTVLALTTGSGIGHGELGQRLVDRGGRRPHLPGFAAVKGDLQRPASTQHDGLGITDSMSRRGEQLVPFGDVVAALLDDIGHPGLHRRDRHRGTVDVEGDGLACGDGKGAGDDQRDEQGSHQESQRR
jgi:hypothetical protein